MNTSYKIPASHFVRCVKSWNSFKRLLWRSLLHCLIGITKHLFLERQKWHFWSLSLTIHCISSYNLPLLQELGFIPFQMKINFDKRHPLEPILIKLILGWHFKPRCYWHGLPSGCDDPSLTEGPMENNHLPQYWIFQAQSSTEEGLDCSLLRETLAKIKETCNLWYSGYQQSYLASGIMWSMLWLSPVITSILLTNERVKRNIWTALLLIWRSWLWNLA